jgi:hypothetical protein
MALTPTEKSVGLYGGLDLKTDAKFVAADKSLTAENLRYTGVRSIQKRYGQTALSRMTAPGSLIQTGKALGTFNNELLMYDGTALYSYSQAAGFWQNRANLTETLVSVQNVTAGVNDASNVSGYSNGAVEVYAWQDSDGNVYYSARDTVTATMFQQNVSLGLGTSPTVVFAGTRAYIFVLRNNAYLAFSLLLANLAAGAGLPTIVSSSVLAGTFPTATLSLDPLNPAILVAYSQDATHITIDKRGLDLTPVASQTIAFLAPNSKLSISPNTVTDTINGTVYYVVGGINANGGVARPQVFAVNVANNTVVAPILVLTLPMASYAVNNFSVNVFNGKIVFAGDASVGAQLDPKPLVFTGTGTITNNTATITANTKYLYGLTLASQVAVRPEGAYWVAASPALNLAGATSQQTTYYLCGVTLTAPDPTILSRYLGELAVTFNGNPVTASVTAAGNIFLGQPFRTALRADAYGTLYSPAAITGVTFTFPATSGVQVVPFNGKALINCGITYDYDGFNVVENGFWEFPDGLLAITTPGAGFQYQYFATYEWTDAQGNVTLSAPSYALVVNLGMAIGSGGTATISVPYTALTKKQNAKVCVYRTTVNNSSPAYKIFTTPNLTGSIGSFLVSDNQTDVQISTRQKLYAPQDFSAEIDNEPAPPFLYMFGTKTRVFGIPQDAPYQLWYSKPSGGAIAPQPRAPEFALGQYLPIETVGGAVTGLSALDTNAVVFKASRIYFLPGNGPNSAGVGSDFPSSLQLISTTTGCISSPSILQTSDGLYFQSNIGISELGRGLQVSPTLGFPVQPLTQSLTITGTQSVAAQSQFRWVSSQGTALVYDYAVGRWSTYTNYDGVGYVSWNGTTARLKSSGEVQYEDPTLYTDNGTVVVMKVETAWLKPAAMAQGFAACWYMELLGDFKSTHTLGMEIAYDYLDVPAQVGIFNPALTGNETYGSDSPYGIGSPYGLGPVVGAVYTALYQPRMALQRQVCESMKFKFYDISGTGASCTLSEIALQLGVIGGLNRVPTRQQV